MKFIIDSYGSEKLWRTSTSLDITQQKHILKCKFLM